jgi:hypothetical protein
VTDLPPRTLAAAGAVRRAFAGTPHPGAVIAARGPVVPFEHDLEAQAIERFFAVRQWPDVTAAALWDDYPGDASACLIFMAPPAFRHFVPAYMLLALEDYVAADVSVSSLVSLLTPWRLVPGSDRECFGFDERMAGLSVPGREAVAGCLLALQEGHPGDWLAADTPSTLLRFFWGEHLPEADRALIQPFDQQGLMNFQAEVAALRQILEAHRQMPLSRHPGHADCPLL